MKLALHMDDKLFRFKLLRDILSIIHDPLMIQTVEADFLQSQMSYAVKKFIDLDSERLFRMIGPPDPRLPLGKWFERVFLVALRITFPFGEVFHSVNDDYGGELDFVVRDGVRLFHIECAIKFFLHQTNAGTGLNGFIGPGGQDRLDLKLSKMKNIQLQRVIPLKMSAGMQAERILWMGGCLHFPIERDHQALNLSAEINPQCLKGFWASAESFFDYLAPGHQLIELPRQWWLTSLNGLPTELLLRFRNLESLSGSLEPTMVAEINPKGGVAMEIRRGFVMPIGNDLSRSFR